MILKAIKILPVMLASLNPSNFNLDQPKKQDTPYSLDLFVESNISTLQTLDAQTNYKLRKQKATGTMQNDAMLVKEAIYNQTYFYEISAGNQINIPKQNFKENSSILHVLQITPYRTLASNEITINIRIRLGTYADADLTNYNLFTEVYNSTESYWNKYIDDGMTNPYLNFEAIQDITNSQLGFTYGSQIYQDTMTETDTTDTLQSKNLTFTLYIENNKTNYFYFYTYGIYPQDQTQDTSHIALSGFSLFGYTTTQKNATISGIMIPPIANYEVVDIPGIMWEVLTMPFTFISVAFNLTLFPNTPYQVNLSNLFLSIIGIIIFAFILSKFIKKV